MSDAKASFRLSRIHAQGWIAGRGPEMPGTAEQNNPYPAEPERSHWQAGFSSAYTDVRKKLP